MGYLNKFNNQLEYAAAQSTLDSPNIALIADNNNMVYNTLNSNASHAYVEIAGIKWATMNLGALSITEPGLYYQWGDTQGYLATQVGSGNGKKYFGWGDYKYNPSGDGETFTKYNEATSPASESVEDLHLTLESSDDAVTAAWVAIGECQL